MAMGVGFAFLAYDGNMDTVAALLVQRTWSVMTNESGRPDSTKLYRVVGLWRISSRGRCKAAWTSFRTRCVMPIGSIDVDGRPYRLRYWPGSSR